MIGRPSLAAVLALSALSSAGPVIIIDPAHGRRRSAPRPEPKPDPTEAPADSGVIFGGCGPPLASTSPLLARPTADQERLRLAAMRRTRKAASQAKGMKPWTEI